MYFIIVYNELYIKRVPVWESGYKGSRAGKDPSSYNNGRKPTGTLTVSLPHFF